MTQEEKELLLKDLCGRLTYGVKCEYYDCCEDDYNKGTICGFERQEYIQIDGVCIHVEEVKPYLFPLSSMTEEQHNELFAYFHDVEMKEIETSGDYLKAAYLGENAKRDWLNKNHFDYHYLIPKGLAKDATGLNIY